MRQSFKNHLLPFSGIQEFDLLTVSYPKTLFRFPLRRKASDLSKKTYSAEQLLELLDALKLEVKHLLLFLRSLESIEVYTINVSQQRSLVFKVEIASEDRDDLRRKRSYLNKKIREAYKRDNKYGITEHLHFESMFTVNVKYAQKSPTCTKWLVSNWIGSSSDAVTSLAEEVHVFPTVGVALEVNFETLSKGRLFCFLPLPPEAFTELPVHVNGTFSLNDDRRGLKWPSQERKDDSAAKWNVVLINEVLSMCYSMLLTKALEILKDHPNFFYQAIPNVLNVRGTKWEGLLKTLSIFTRYPSFYTLSGNWVRYEEATIIPEIISESSIPEVVYDVMQERSHNLVKLPSAIWEALQYVNLIEGLKKLSPKLVRQVLKADLGQKYKKLLRSQKLDILSYCLSDSVYSELPGLWLLPLANGNFSCFQNCGSHVYVCTKKCHINLLPGAHDHVISVPEEEYEQLQTVLQNVAYSKQTQLRLLQPEIVAHLLSEKCFSDHVFQSKEISIDKFPEDWFQIFWKWLERQDLILFKNLPLVLVKGIPTNIKVLKLKSGSGVVFIEKNQRCSSDIFKVLNKLNVKCVLQSCVPYIRHKDIFKFFQQFTADGILKAIEEANPSLSSIQSVSISHNEATSFQYFISGCTLGHIIQCLPIFHTVKESAYPVAVHSGVIILEPEGNTLAPDCLPSNFIMLSRSNNISSVVNACNNIKFPQYIVEFVQEFVFPLIQSGEFKPLELITPMMEEIFKIFPKLESQMQSDSFVTSVAKVPFLHTSETSAVLKTPKDLFDPSNKNLRRIYCGEDVFPIAPFTNEIYLVHLYKCGLQKNVSGQDVYDILSRISEPPGIHKVHNKILKRVKHVFLFIKCNRDILNEKVIVYTNIGEYLRLDQAIYSLAQKRSILPIESQPSLDYPSILSWKGSSCNSHLTTMNNSVLPLSSSDIEVMPNIVGSETYIVYCPSSLCSILRKLPPLREVLVHFTKLIDSKRDIETKQLTKLAIQTYEFLQDNADAFMNISEDIYKKLCEKEWVWIKKFHNFFIPNQVAFSKHETFDYKLTPYIHVLPETYARFMPIMTHYGAHETVTDDLLVSVLDRIRVDEHTNARIKWNFVTCFLKWVTDDGKRYAKCKVDLDKMLVPVENTDSLLQLEKVKDVVFTDVKYLKKYIQQKEASLKFIHKSFEHISKYLGVIPLSEKLKISEDAFEDVGQSEPLARRLKNILKDYSGELTIIKELLQNADDAGATEVNICYDSRTHTQDSDTLLFPGMARAHGPALIVHNNEIFSDDDFKNIQKLAGATKQDQPLKIGKFGVGFCSVYHITDVPSFVSREFLYIFDPNLEYLKDEISDLLKPGKRLRFTDRMVKYSEQMNPYKGLFEFEAEQPFHGTIFRLPLREKPSKISSKCYNHNDISKIVEDVRVEGPELLLFLSHLKSISFRKIDDSGTETVLLSVQKEVVHILSCGTKIVRICVYRNGMPHESENHWLVAETKTDKHISSVACALEKSEKHYLHRPVTGKMFCFLPLHLETGLPVHVSANFAVMNDRRGIHYSDSTCKSEESQFNLDLMSDSIPHSYISLLVALRKLCHMKKRKLRDYNCNFFSLWPLMEVLKIKNPWETFIPILYNLISNERLCYSQYLNKWLTVTESYVLSPDILHQDHFHQVETVIQLLKEPVIALPHDYHLYLDPDTIDENEFLHIFFDNIREVPSTTRNDILFSLIKVYGIEQTTERKLWIEKYPCIPCMPDGEIIKTCGEIVNPKSEKIALLYDPEDGVFPIESFHHYQILASLSKLGMLSSKLPWLMIIERARTVKELYHADKRVEALKRTKILLKCMEENVNEHGLPDEAHCIKTIPFLPALQKPMKYPKILEWAGKCQSLLHSTQLLREIHYGYQISNLVGSERVIVSQKEPCNGGCGHISEKLAHVLQINFEPSIDDVINHLIHISNSYSSSKKTQRFKSYMNSACQEIYKFFNEFFHKNGEKNDNFLQNFHGSHKLIWNGEDFIHPKSIASSWEQSGPYLYGIPYFIKDQVELVKQLNIREKFERNQLLQVLSEIKSVFQDKPISEEYKKIVKSIAQAIVKDIDRCSEEPEGYLYDEKCRMQHVKDLACNDAHWCKLKNDCFFVHPDFSRRVVEKMGIKFVLSKALDYYDVSNGHFDGVPFGQHEEITQRIRNILDSYIYNETILKELLQNADDAKATKLYFILDERYHKKRKLPSNNWKDLQGPALLVWNDKGFTEEDLVGIQKLGLGSKRTKAESIGQYGIGFNVVYHLTDCPSLLTNGSTLCIFDPHCQYVPGANSLKPGRRLDNVDKEFWDNYSDLRSAYLQENIDDCPKEIQISGSLFRFPLRYSQELVDKSKLVDKHSSPLEAKQVKEQMQNWAPQLKESLLFLKHVVELVFCVIPARTTMSKLKVIHKFRAGLDAEGVKSRSNLYSEVNRFRKEPKTPFITHYCVSLIEEVPKRQLESWLVQQGVGDVNNHSQHWEYLSHIYPMHGLAAQIRGEFFTPKIFCFLPLPLPSNLPVHVNANFFLDSSSRSSLWKSRDVSTPDDKKKWNDRLIEALGSSYALFLVNCQNYFVKSGPYTTSNQSDLTNSFKKYYKLFPKWLNPIDNFESEMMTLAKLVYTRLADLKYHIFAVVDQVPKHSIGSTRSKAAQSTGEDCRLVIVSWEPGMNEDSSKQVYFWKEYEVLKSIHQILKKIGMTITVAPIEIKNHFGNLSRSIPQATPESVFEYYSSHYYQASTTGTFPCKVKDSRFHNMQSFKAFVRYVACCQTNINFRHQIESINVVTFPMSPCNLPLLLTADEYIRKFDGTCLMSEYSSLFPGMQKCFLHPAFLDLNLDQNYFLIPDLKNESLIFKILEDTLPNSLKNGRIISNANSVLMHKTRLSKFWKCFHDDQVFSKHRKQIVQRWALILSSKDNLHLYTPSHEHLMPLAHPRRLPSSTSTEILLVLEHQNQSNVFNLLISHGMAATHSIVRTAEKYCPTLDKHVAVLKNLWYLYKHQALPPTFLDEDIILLFSYFKSIHFREDATALTLIKSLPLFKTVSNSYSSLTGEVFLLPQNVDRVGIGKVLQRSTTVFLKSEGAWTNLASPDVLNIKSMDDLNFYTDLVFPNFDILSDTERLSQLTHIKDKLFKKAEIVSEIKNDNVRKFLESLQKLPIFFKHGVLVPIDQFYDPENQLFKLFPNIFIFPPEPYCSKLWLPFFKKLGLQTSPVQTEFLKLCKQLSEGKNNSQTDLIEASSALLKCLFQTVEWQKDESFLREVNCIYFIHPENTTHLSWIVKPSNDNVHYIQHQQDRIALVSLKDSVTHDCAELIWTVRPVVCFPKMQHTPFSSKRYEEKLAFYAKLGICSKPDESLVVENLKNISKSRFSHFKLFEIYSPDCVRKDDNACLFEVVSKNLKYLHERSACLTSLMDVPCIPVNKDADDNIISHPILVRPLQVISCSSSELQPTLHPFLNLLPKDLYPVLTMLQKMRVNSQIKSENIICALGLIKTEVMMPLDPITIETVRLFMKMLYNQLDTDSAFEKTSVLYLPDYKYSLFQSTKLLYDDKGYHKKVNYDFNHCKEYSALSMLCCDKIEENEKYGFDMKSFVSKIPPSHAPLSFSANSKSEIRSGYQKQEDSMFVEKLKKALMLENFADIIGKMLKHEPKSDCNACDKFSSCLKDCLAILDIVTIADLTVDITLIHPCAPTKIGKANMDFLLEEQNSTVTMYIDSKANAMRHNLLESLSEYFVGEIIKRANLKSSSISNPERCFAMLLKAESIDDVKLILMDMGINTTEILIDRKFDYVLNPKLGEAIPEDWYHRLHADLLNTFRPQELVGFEEWENCFIFARVEYRANQISRLNNSGDEEMDMYVIRIQEGEDDSECKKTVPVIDLYKILRIKEIQQDIESTELELYNPDDEFVRIWESTKDVKLRDIYKIICDELRRINRISDEDLKRKCLKAMYLKWHPDKNNHPLATKAFQFLQRQIDRMKRGLDLEDPEAMDAENPQVSREYHNEWFTHWNNLSRQRNRSRRREHNTYRENSYRNRGDWFGCSSGSTRISVSPDLAKAKVWLEQAEYDMKVTEYVDQKCKSDVKVSAHVCFLAHQVAEKSLKACMYAKNGLHPDSLQNHDLISHAHALEQLNANAAGLATNVHSLQDQDCYLKTRYPNRFGAEHKVPSNEFSQEQARDALQSGRKIFEIVKKIW